MNHYYVKMKYYLEQALNLELNPLIINQNNNNNN